MSARLVTEVALRVMGLWLVAAAIGAFADSLYFFLPGTLNQGTLWMVMMFAGASVSRGLVGGALIYWAPAIAAQWYPPDARADSTMASVGPGALYRVACLVLGVYVLLRAAEPGTRLIVNTFRGGQLNAAVDAGVTLIYVAAGVFLVFGSQRLATFFSNLYYDPDTIPKQRLSIAILLVVILLFAVFLALTRRLAMSGG